MPRLRRSLDLRPRRARARARAVSLLVLGLVLAVGAVACTGDGPEDEGEPLTITFMPRVGDAEFACGTRYDGLGRTGAAADVEDFRLYLHGITLLHPDGSSTALALDESDWQRDGVALLDFEDASGGCVGSPETNLTIVGRRPSDATIAGLEFTLGVPEALNHLDSASAPPPLNLPGMYWSWMGGYRFLRVDLMGAEGAPFVFHLGSAGCTGTTAEGFACSQANRATLRFPEFDPAAQAIAVDLAALFATSDLEAEADPEVDPVAGCMSGLGDPECPPLFRALGLVHASDDAPAGAQTVFYPVDMP